MKIDEKFRARFEAKFDRGSEGCWLWKASVAGAGYGQIKLPGQRRQVYAHRLAYELYVGPVPADKQVLHKCDTPRCVRPDHLFVGDDHSNHLDMKSKDRHLYGARNGNAKLDDARVSQIHRCLAMGMTQRQVAAAMGVHQTVISKIARGERWAHLKPEAP